METIEKTVDVLNDLIKINNDRVEGFEKAAEALDEHNTSLRPVFDRLAGESRANAEELSRYVWQYGADPADGTSTAGSLHRAWLEIKATFTGSDLTAILDECERGEDAIKQAYTSALKDADELSVEALQAIQRQQAGIIGGHNLIKSLRDQNKRVTEQAEKGSPVDRNFVNINGEVKEGPVDVGEYKNEPINNRRNEKPPVTDEKLQEFFVNELKDLLWAERKLVDTLPKMRDAANTAELRGAFQEHLIQTVVHVQRLEDIFGTLGLDPDTTKCEAMNGIVDEGEEIIDDTDEGTASRDIGLIFAGQKAEHYEIASYGGMIGLANTLGLSDEAQVLTMTLDEEKAADAILTKIAQNNINYHLVY